MDTAVERWITAGAAGDAAAAADCLTADAEFVSPLTDRFSFRGRDQVRTLLEAVFSVVTDFHCVERTGDGELVAVRSRGRMDRIRLEEAQLLRLTDGAITEVRLFVRPVPAATALMRALGPLLAPSRTGAAVLGAATGGLHVLAAAGDRSLVPLARPR
jgi:ketosteroid isomerase-like protein